MKIGNVSQTIVPVPSFFLDQDSRKLETFTIYKKLRPRASTYYRDRDLFTRSFDMNINHNPRVNRNQSSLNKEKYIPLYHRGRYPSNSELKETYFPHIIDNSLSQTVYPESEWGKYKDYKNKTNYNELVRPELRNEIMNNTQHLLERINANYDIDKWSKFDSKTTFNKFFQTAYSPLTDYINQNASFKDAFNETLRTKADSLRTLNPQAKSNVVKNLKKIEQEKNEEEEEAINNQNDLDKMLDNCKSNLLNLKKENTAPFEYSNENQKFINDNKYMLKPFQNTTLYKEFVSPSRMEFNKKKVKVQKKKFKINECKNHVNKNNYSFNEKELLSCQQDMWKRPLHKDAFV
jgi:hypothetical protein